MAAAMRIKVGCVTRKLVQFSFSQHCCLRDIGISRFHRSAFLSVMGQEVKMPSLSPTMSEGTIVKWLKKEGDAITAGDVLCDIQTDKAVVSFEIEEDGILAKILVPESSTDIKVGSLIALMVNEGEDWKNVEFSASAAESSSSSPSSPSPPSDSGSASSPPSDSGSASSPPNSESGFKPQSIPGATFNTTTITSYGPAVKYLLERYELKANVITPTGHRGKLLKEDVLKYIQTHNLTEKPSKPVPPPTRATQSSKPVQQSRPAKETKKTTTGGFAELQVSNIRKTIAKRLSESKKNIPHSYASIASNIDKIMELRKQLKADDIRLSVNDFILKAVGHGLQQYPEVNAHWIQDKLIPVPNVDISVAVATDRGLMTPIVMDVPGKGLVEISATVRNLAKRAREGKLQPHEFQGGSFTVSNLGMFGLKEFSAIINPPQCGILAVGAGRAILDSEGKKVTQMNVTLSYDGRAFDEDVAAAFLKYVQTMLQDPSMIIVAALPDLRQTLEA